MPNVNEFPVTVYGQLEKYNEVMSKARVRIFYKGGNRNGTYISDQFADKLIASIPYAPVKGIYEGDDFTDHGETRDQGRIYGIVPQDPNFAWETHQDEDGVTRMYACVDLLIFTALYKEAGEIVGKAQSMELYGPSLKYHDQIIDGTKYIVFDEGCFLGLQVLGDETEPCFEGASFYTLRDTIEEVINKLQALSETYTNKGGQLEMPEIIFKLSDSQKYDALWDLLNPDFKKKCEVCSVIVDVYDDYALVRNLEAGDYERVYYTKNDESDSIEISSREKVFVMDITENEKVTIETLRKINKCSLESVDEVVANAEENFAKLSEAETQIVELNDNLSTLNTEMDTLKASVEEYTSTVASKDELISTLTEELNNLKEYKHNAETLEKQTVIAEYESLLSEELLNSFRAELDNYTVTDLDMHLAYELKKSNKSVFQSGNQGGGFTPIDAPKTGIDAILDKYKK